MTLNKESAGDQLCLRMSMHILPLSEIYTWDSGLVNCIELDPRGMRRTFI